MDKPGNSYPLEGPIPLTLEFNIEACGECEVDAMQKPFGLKFGSGFSDENVSEGDS
jgi:hypothetical protein